MPANLKLRPRMRSLLSPAVAQAEWVGIIAWVGMLLIPPTLKLDLYMLAVTVGLLIVCRVHATTANFLLWRVLGVIYMVLLSVGFAYLIHLNEESRIYGLPLAVTLVVGSAILFISVQDYLVDALLIWLILWPPMQADIYVGTEVYLLLFCAASVSIGFILSYSYLKNLRSVLLVESEFRALAETDYLTSILNRRAWRRTGFCPPS